MESSPSPKAHHIDHNVLSKLQSVVHSNTSSSDHFLQSQHSSNSLITNFNSLPPQYRRSRRHGSPSYSLAAGFCLTTLEQNLQSCKTRSTDGKKPWKLPPSSASSYLRVVSIHMDHRTTDHLANVSAVARRSEEMSKR